MSDSKLPTPLIGAVDSRPPARSHEMWRVIDSARSQRRAKNQRPGHRHLMRFACAACVALVVTLAANLSVRPSAEGALVRSDRRALPARMLPLSAYEILDLSDGSRITAAQGARLDLLASSGRSFSLALRQGRVRFDVRPHGPRSWRIDCGAVAVEVVGTAFTIERLHGRVDVRVMRGAVLVRGPSVPDGVQRLNAGQALHVAAPQERPGQGIVPAEPPQGEPPPISAPRQTAHPSMKSSRRSASRGAPQDTRIDKRLDFLWREADAARARGEGLAAVAPLEALVATETDRTRAALAAFTLAKLRLGALNQAQQASSDLRLALELGLREPLAEEARARLVEGLWRSGDSTAACAAARAYRAIYPHGLRELWLPGACEPSPASD